MSYTFKKLTFGGGGGSGIIDVTALPTENIDENAVYRLTEEKPGGAEVYLVLSNIGVATLEDAFATLGMPIATPTYVVPSLPAQMEAFDEAALIMPLYVIESTGIAYVSGDGTPDTAVKAGTFLGGVDSKGWTDNIGDLDPSNPDDEGVYCVRGTVTSISLYTRSNGEWVGYIDDEIQGKYDEAVAKNEALTSENETLTSENATLTSENETLTSENATLTSEVETLTNANTTLTSENLDLSNDNIKLRARDTALRLDTEGGFNFARWASLFAAAEANELAVAGANDTTITAITFPDGVTRIAEKAFERYVRLESVVFGKDVKHIGTNAFTGCTSLKSIIFGENSQLEIGKRIFDDCPLEYIDFSKCKAIPTLTYADAFGYIPATCEIRVPAALYDQWKAAEYWSEYANHIVSV